MSEPRCISPMLDGFSLGQAISDHSGVECYPAMRNDSEKRYIVKKISLPASQVQVEALLLTGVYQDEQAVGEYYKELAQLVRQEVRILDQLAGQRGFVPFQGCQIEPMEDGVGYEVYLLSRYRKSLERHTRRNPMTHLGALNLGIDLCAALAVSREAGWLFVDLKPENIYLFNDQEYRIGDLGFVAMDSLEYASLPDRYRSLYTAPEVADAYSSLNATMDTYALGLVLYQVYNEGKLPFADLEERKAWLEKLASGESIAAPSCADEEMAELIRKAIAPDPADRWQTPAEMGHALISYMQRNGADDIPIVPPAPVEEAQPEEPLVEETEETAEETAEASETDDSLPEEEAAESEEVPAEPVETPAETEESVEAEESAETETPVEAVAEEPAVETSEEESGESTADWIDLMDAFLAEEEEPGAPAPGEGEPTLRELLSDTDELSAEAETVTQDELSAEAADILTAANELIEHEAPAPVVVPEPVDLPVPEPIAVELPGEEPPPEETDSPEEPAETTEPAAPAVPAEPPKHKGLVKKLLKTAAALAAAAAIFFAAWYFYENYYLQTIDSMTWEGTATQVTVTVSTAMDESKLTVVCKDTYGNAVNGTLENGTVTFSDLVPGSQYIITLEPMGFHKLLGTTYITYSTPAETKVMHLTAVTGQEPGSAIVSFGVEGQDSDEWTLTCEAEGQEALVIPFTGHTVTVNELTIGTEYTFTLTTAADVLLVGENVITHTASDLIQAQDLALSEYKDGTLTLTWKTPEGVSVDSWIIRCYDNAGYDQLQEVEGNTAAFTGVTEGGKYIVEVTASNMTLGTRAEVTAEASAVSGFTAVLNGSTVDMSWNATADTSWIIEFSADGQTPYFLIPSRNTASYGPVAPGTVYTFAIKAANVSADIPAATATVEVPAAGTFSANKLDSETVIVEMFDVPTKSNWKYNNLLRAKEQDTFKPGGELALLYTVTKPYDSDSADFETIFVIRDSEGRLVSASARTRSWNDMWDNGYCTETVSNLPTTPGSYTLSIIIQGGTLAELPFTIK